MISKKNRAFKSQIFSYLKRKGKRGLAGIAKAKKRESSEPDLKKKPLKRINTGKKSAPEKPSPERLKKFADYLATSRSIAGSLSIIILSLLLIYAVYTEIKRDNFQINSISIPPDFEKNGLSSQVIANKLAAKVNDISKGSSSLSKIGPASPPSNETTLPDATVPSTNISLKTFINYLKPKPRSVGGEITANAKELNITIHIYNNRYEGELENEIFIGSSDNLDALLNKAAEYIVKTTYPYAFAAYLYENERRDEAIELAKYCVYSAPDTDDARGYILWGLILYEEGDRDEDKDKLDEAIKKYQTAEQLDPTLRDYIYINWGLIHEKKDERLLAIEKYKKAIEVNPKASRAYNNLGYIFLTDKDYDAARENFNKAIELEPRDILPYKNLGLALIKQKKYKEAEAVYDRAIALNSEKEKEIYIAWAGALKEENNFDDAITKYEKIIKKNPCDSKAYEDWGYILQLKGEVSNAILKYQEAVRCDNKNAGAYWNWGDLVEKMQGGAKLRELKRYKDVISVFQRALETSPPNEGNYWAMAHALKIIGKYLESEVYYKKAIEINPRGYTKRSEFAGLLKGQRKYKDALEQYEKVKEIKPDSQLAVDAEKNIKEIQDKLKKTPTTK